MLSADAKYYSSTVITFSNAVIICAGLCSRWCSAVHAL